MSKEPLSFEEVEELFRTLGIRTFGAALPEGRIHWMDESGTVVAHGSCLAILSFAAANGSVMWAGEIPAFRQANVPVIPRPESFAGYQENVNEKHAEAMATAVCRSEGALFLYRAPSGGGGALFLAVTEFHPGGLEADPDDAARRSESARAWAFTSLTGIGALLEQGGSAEEAGLLLGRLRDQAHQQAEFVLKGLPAATEIDRLGDQAAAWAAAVPDHRDRVAYELNIAARRWDSLAGEA